MLKQIRMRRGHIKDITRDRDVGMPYEVSQFRSLLSVAERALTDEVIPIRQWYLRTAHLTIFDSPHDTLFDDPYSTNNNNQE